MSMEGTVSAISSAFQHERRINVQRWINGVFPSKPAQVIDVVDTVIASIASKNPGSLSKVRSTVADAYSSVASGLIAHVERSVAAK